MRWPCELSCNTLFYNKQCTGRYRHSHEYVALYDSATPRWSFRDLSSVNSRLTSLGVRSVNITTDHSLEFRILADAGMAFATENAGECRNCVTNIFLLNNRLRQGSILDPLRLITKKLEFGLNWKFRCGAQYAAFGNTDMFFKMRQVVVVTEGTRDSLPDPA